MFAFFFKSFARAGAAASFLNQKRFGVTGAVTAAAFGGLGLQSPVWAAPRTSDVASRFRCSPETAQALVNFELADRTLSANLDEDDIATVSRNCDEAELRRIIAESVGCDVRDARAYEPAPKSHTTRSVSEALSAISADVSRIKIRPIEDRLAGKLSHIPRTTSLATIWEKRGGHGVVVESVLVLGPHGGFVGKRFLKPQCHRGRQNLPVQPVAQMLQMEGSQTFSSQVDVLVH